MIEIGTIKNINGYKVKVKIETSNDEVDAVLMMGFSGQALTILQVKESTQVMLWMSENVNVVLGTLPSDDDTKPDELILQKILELLQKLQLPTPSGMSGVPIPTNQTEITRLLEQIKKIWL